MFGELYAERLPDYFRLDARLTRVIGPGCGFAALYLEALNILGRSNVMDYTYDAAYEERREIASLFREPTLVFRRGNAVLMESTGDRVLRPGGEPVSAGAIMLPVMMPAFSGEYVLPLLPAAVQVIVFVGIVRLRFYDIEVRGARTGEHAARAAAAERLALPGEVSASIAHEVRNPLTGMRSLAQTLAEEDDIGGRAVGC